MRRLCICLALALAAATGAPAASQDELHYTALGDSIATGYLVQDGYVDRYAAILTQTSGLSVTLYNLAQNGWSSGQLLNALRTNTTIQAAVGQADQITWNIGVNDWRNARSKYKSGKCGGKDNQDCLRSVVATFRANWSGIVSELLNRRGHAAVSLKTLDVFNPWSAADIGANVTADAKETGAARGDDFSVLDSYLAQINTHIHTTSTAAGILVGAAHAAFNGADGREDPRVKGYIGSDGLHPTELGHQVLADLLR